MRRRGGLGAVFFVVALFAIAKGCGEEGGPSGPKAESFAEEIAFPEKIEDGLALALVYDTSGSMNDETQTKGGGREKKFRVANKALGAIVDRLEQWQKGKTAEDERKLEVGLFVFEGDEGARAAVPFGRFDGAALRAWLRSFANPDGGTPLGTALGMAGRAVIQSGLSRKHVLVLTDGESNRGPDPAQVLRTLKSAADGKSLFLGAHFVAFDIAAAVFAPVKAAGATLVSASDEAQLNDKLAFLLEEEILLER